MSEDPEEWHSPNYDPDAEPEPIGLVVTGVDVILLLVAVATILFGLWVAFTFWDVEGVSKIAVAVAGGCPVLFGAAWLKYIVRSIAHE